MKHFQIFMIFAIASTSSVDANPVRDFYNRSDVVLTAEVLEVEVAEPTILTYNSGSLTGTRSEPIETYAVRLRTVNCLKGP